MLKDWTLNYIKNRDLVHRRISNVEDKGDYFLVTHKDESHIVFLVHEKMDDLSEVVARIKQLEKEHNATKISLVIYNTKSNLELLLKHWKELVEIVNLTVVFANPRIADKWIISPHVHDKIADAETLELGVRTMFESVEEY